MVTHQLRGALRQVSAYRGLLAHREAADRGRRLMAGTRSTRMAAVWRASFDRQVCGIEIGIT
jgi:hypothetical protein